MSKLRGDGSRNRILGELQALRAEMDRALSGPIPARDWARDVAHRLRLLQVEARRVETIGDPASIESFARTVADAVDWERTRVLGVFGTSVWDDRTDGPNLGPLPPAPGGGVAEPPLTDEDLAQIEGEGPRLTPDLIARRLARRLTRVLDLSEDEEASAAIALAPYVVATRASTLRLVAEVRRLRERQGMT